MDDPIDQLLEDHRVIMDQIEGLRVAVRDLQEHGEEAAPVALPVLDAVGRMMATQLLLHAKKEDEALFPALEEVFGDAGSPTSVMRQEHRDIHAQAERFRKTLRELNEIEHPAIVAQGAELRALTSRGGRAEDLRLAGTTIIELLDAHFAKEEDILFPMARQLLSSEKLREVARKMETLEGA